MSTEDFPKLSLDEILNGRKAAQRSMAVCMRLDLLADIEERERKIVKLQDPDDDDDARLGYSEAAQLKDEIREFEAEAEHYTIDLRLQALDRKLWHQKVDQFTEVDDSTGVSKFDIAALTLDVFHQSLVSPTMSAEQQGDFLAKLSEAQWAELMNLVFDLNRKTVTVGKSLTASMVTKPKSAKQGPDGR